MENPQLMAKKRKQQLKQSLEHLGGRFEDVIFIGDMNWNDSKDGLCPIEQPWEDRLKLEVRRYSYDAKREHDVAWKLVRAVRSSVRKVEKLRIAIDSNGGYKSRGERTSDKPYIEKGEQKKIKVDVLPSDHYGLLLILKKKSCLTTTTITDAMELLI